MRLQKYITELSFRKDVDVEITKNQAWMFQTEFAVQGAARGHGIDGSQNALVAMGGSIEYVVTCTRSDNWVTFKYLGDDIWEVSFFPRYDARPAKSSLEHGQQVFAGVYKSIKLLIQKKIPNVLWFHAATPRLDKVYKKLVPLMAKDLRGYKYVKHLDKYIFYRQDQFDFDVDSLLRTNEEYIGRWPLLGFSAKHYDPEGIGIEFFKNPTQREWNEVWKMDDNNAVRGFLSLKSKDFVIFTASIMHDTLGPDIQKNISKALKTNDPPHFSLDDQGLWIYSSGLKQVNAQIGKFFKRRLTPYYTRLKNLDVYIDDHPISEFYDY